MPFSLLFLPVFLFIVLRLYLSPRVKYPPGPRPLPLIGNVLDVPVERPEVRFTEWGSHYGTFFLVNRCIANEKRRRLGLYSFISTAGSHPQQLASCP